MSATPPSSGTEPDPIHSDDREILRHTILELRDRLHAFGGREEVLADRIAELEASESALAADVATLHAELNRSPIRRLVGALQRRWGRRR